MNKYVKAVVAARADFESHVQRAGAGSQVRRICESILADFKEHGNGLFAEHFQERVAELAKVAGEGDQQLVQSAEHLRKAAQENEDYF